MNKERFINSVVSHYLKGHKMLVVSIYYKYSEELAIYDLDLSNPTTSFKDLELMYELVMDSYQDDSKKIEWKCI